MAPARVDAAVSAGSKATIARPDSGSISTVVTPGSASTAFRTCDSQPPQVIPPTSKVVVSNADGICDMGSPSGSDLASSAHPGRSPPADARGRLPLQWRASDELDG